MRIQLLVFLGLLSIIAVDATCLCPCLLAGKGLALAGGGALALKLAPKLLLGGGAALIGKKLIKKKKCCCKPRIGCGLGCGCNRCGLFRRRRSISDIAGNLSSRAFRAISDRLEGTGSSIRSIGNQFHSVSDRIRNVSFTTRAAGIIASDRIRSTAANLLGTSSSSNSNLVRTRRAAPRRSNAPRNFSVPRGKMSVEEMLNFVRQHNAQVCLQRVICELSADTNIYGQEGIRFGTKLLDYQNIDNQEARMYKAAAAFGNRNRGRPSQCRRRYPSSSCSYDPAQLIAVGNSILY